MKRIVTGSFAFLLVAVSGAPSLHAEAPKTLRPIKMRDALAWKSIRAAVVSPDGAWFAYQLSPNEGDSEVVVRQTQGEKETRFPIGQARGPLFGPMGPAPAPGLAFSKDSKWLAFAVHATAKEAKALQKEKKPSRDKAVVVNLATGARQEFDSVKHFAFSGDNAGWIALHRYPAEAQESGPDKWAGSDLILHELATGNELNLGNVSEFAFDKRGDRLAVVIDAQGQTGNGVELRDMTTSALRPLDNGRASYKLVAWTEKGNALAVLKGTEDKGYEDKLYAVLGFADLGAKAPRKTVFDPRSNSSFPAGMTVSPDRAPAWTENLGGILFGIHKVKKKKDDKKPQAAQAGKAPGDRPATGKSPADDDKEKADLVIWHWKDDRLQSQQQVQAAGDKAFNYLCEYRVADKKFLRLADESLRNVTADPRHAWALGTDSRSYDLMASLDGKQFHDYYAVNLQTGQRKPIAKKNRWAVQASPDGKRFLFYEDGHYLVFDATTGKARNVTEGVPTSFVNVEDDHNVEKPPRPPLGWAKDGSAVVLSDGWDAWSVPVEAGHAVNLTGNGKAEALRYRRRFVLDEEEKGIDLSRPQLWSVYGEWTKKTGIARTAPDRPAAERLFWDDADFGALLKAKHADVYLYTRGTAKEYPDYYVTDPSLHPGRRLTQADPQQDQFLWSSGQMLLDYTSAKGKKLQAALFLPANYEKGKRYPTIVYIYEKLSQGLNQYTVPTATGFDRSVYTSNGYAVLMPDITYQVNDPGRSAVWCVLPALEAAVTTGVVDRDHVGLHGHSWGGYQTAFLITQTDAFKAAAAGAPLTDMVSMYSSIYWNTGWTNQPIFESSQGRFTGGYWEDMDAYVRNSPVFFAKNVKTPLLLLHNDKDGAVDWHQGIEYFNTLRRLRKPVVWLQYKGENHGLVKPANQKDYTVRMQEFFDHYLRGKPARAWLREGVPHLQLDEFLQDAATSER